MRHDWNCFGPPPRKRRPKAIDVRMLQCIEKNINAAIADVEIMTMDMDPDDTRRVGWSLVREELHDARQALQGVKL
jgi:hypothetical protein